MQNPVTRPLARATAIAGLALGAALALFWALGAMGPVAEWAADQQRQVQDALAGAVRALRGGQAGAWAALLSVCFAYGFFHAAGPGHGKAVIGGYAVARRVPLSRLLALALGSSLAQGAVAVALVVIGAFALGWSRERMEATAAGTMEPLSFALIAGLGVWILWRGARGLARAGGGHQPRAHHGHGHDPHHHGHDHHGHSHHTHGHHTHHHGPDCAPDCGHHHGPTAEDAARITGFRDAFWVIAAVAMRPCSGALMLLVLTLALGVPWAGVAGVVVMALGTSIVTMGVAGAALWLREGALATLPAGRLRIALPLLEVTAGAVIAALAIGVLVG